MSFVKNLVDCCEKFKSNIDDYDGLCVDEHCETVEIVGDGQTLFYEIEYCPFCGKKIEFK